MDNDVGKYYADAYWLARKLALELEAHQATHEGQAGYCKECKRLTQRLEMARYVGD